jgi:arylsulfatase A-like enzyme
MTNAPLRGGKQSDFEGGIRVPLIIKYPGHIKEGAGLITRKQPGHIRNIGCCRARYASNKQGI